VERLLGSLDPRPRVLTLHAHDFEGMFRDLREVGKALGRDPGPLERSLRRRIAALRRALRGLRRRRILMLEWFDPPFASGHWVPEQAALAGGCEVLAAAGKPSTATTWGAIAEADPDVIVAIPCGMRPKRALEEVRKVAGRPEWRRLRAVRAGDVWVSDGPAYFNGAGPRLVDGVELLAGILHPERVGPRGKQALRVPGGDA
jgi:iron complex transport system substrate-binding protein